MTIISEFCKIFVIKQQNMAETGKVLNDEEAGKEMGFWDHVEEMRSRIIWTLIGVIIGCVLAGIFIKDIMEYVLIFPARNVGMDLQNLKPFGQPFLYFKIILTVGIIISVPFILFQLWKFVSPGLYTKERRWARSITFFTSICFFSGVVFSYFVMIPSMLKFSVSFQTVGIKNLIDVNEYFSFITMKLLASGILFEMQMVSYILAKIGILTPKIMRKYRRHSVIVIVILAAVLTPTPDPISQIIFAAPLFILYELSILIAYLGKKKAEKTI
jgi:sec-independent protein translocase protein TatC